MDQTTQITLLIWGISTLATLLIGFLVRRQNGKLLPDLSESVGLALAVAGLLLGIKIIYQAFTDPGCQSSLGQDGTIALVIGGAASVWISSKEIGKFIFPV